MGAFYIRIIYRRKFIWFPTSLDFNRQEQLEEISQLLFRIAQATYTNNLSQDTFLTLVKLTYNYIKKMENIGVVLDIDSVLKAINPNN